MVDFPWEDIVLQTMRCLKNFGKTSCPVTDCDSVVLSALVPMIYPGSRCHFICHWAVRNVLVFNSQPWTKTDNSKRQNCHNL